jgi:uncharacterized protein
MSETERILRSLDSHYTEPIRDPLWKHIYLSPELARIVGSRAFVKLAGIRQLGPSYLVYPGATHTRHAHSLGVFHLAKRMIRSILSRGESDFLDDRGVRSFLAAALLHDLGHFPFAHSLKELPLRDHEALTADAILAEPLRSAVGRSGADPELSAAIIDRERPAGGEVQVDFFRGILSGVLDPDKLDYLDRDAYFCGVPYGIQDIDFVFSRIRADGDRGLAIDSRGIQSVESVLFSKYLMYKSVYWHRMVRSATSMVKKAVIASLNRGNLRPEELYGLDDGSFALRLGKLPAPHAVLASRVFEGDLYRCVEEIPFRKGDPDHERLLSLEGRALAEEAAAERVSRSTGKKLGGLDIVIDIPEPIRFESDLPISDEGVPFSGSSTVFKPEVVRGFAESLRMIRVFVAPEKAEGVGPDIVP